MKKVTLIALLFCFTCLQAQYRNPFFNVLTVETGLPEANIISTVQDKYGYLWLGTQNGLVRYDGYRLKQYTMPNDEGLPVIASSITYLYEDSEGKLWAIVFMEGIYYYDREKDVFLKAALDKPAQEIIKRNDPRLWIEDTRADRHWLLTFDRTEEKAHILNFDASNNKLEDYGASGEGRFFIPAYNMADIKMDRTGKIWMVADSLLSYFDPGTKSFRPFFVLPDTSRQTLFFSIHADPVDADMLWLNTYKPDAVPGQTLSKYPRIFLSFNTRNKTYRIFKPDNTNPASIPDNCVHILTDSSKRVWFSTEKGISLYNRKDENFINYSFSYPKVHGHTEVIAADKEGNLWMAGIFNGIFYLDMKKAQTFLYKTSDEEGSLPSNANISNVFFDRSGTFWVNMPFRGIAYLNKEKSLFNPSPVNPDNINVTGSDLQHPYHILGKQGDSICFLTDTTRLLAWHIKNNSYENINLKNNAVYRTLNSVIADKGGNLWISTWGFGLYSYNSITKSIKNFRYNAGDNSSIGSNSTVAIAIDHEGVLWIGTGDKGLNSFNSHTKMFTRYPYAKNTSSRLVKDSLDDQSAQCLFVDSEGILWIGTNNGSLNRFDIQTGKFKSYLNYKEGFFCVTSIFEDSHRRLWVGTYLSGLFLVDRQTGTFKKYTEKDGLIHNSVFGLQEDAAGNIWIATSRGLSRLTPADNHFVNFFSVISQTVDFVARLHKDSEGVFYLISKNGAISFNPGHMQENSIPPTVVIESISYRVSGSANNPDTVLYTEGHQKIRLKYNENKISFQYIALHFANALLNQYAYQLEGYDKGWTRVGAQRSVTYTNLSPGTYTFRVKAANSDGVWNETGASFTVIVLPPWWKTWWAYTIYVLLIGGSIWAFVQYRSRALRRKNLVLEEKVTHRTRQLQESIESLKAAQSQLIQSEKMASLGELTAGIAHEIQNPLNFVNNFSEVNKELIEELNAERIKPKADRNEQLEGELLNDIKENEEKINHHGKRADAIVKGMLQHSRTSSGQKEPTDINALCDEYLRLAYHGLRAKDKTFNAKFQTDFDSSTGKINIVAQDIGRVILNLINNAFYAVSEKAKYTPVNYEPTVIVKTSLNPPSATADKLGGRGGFIEIRVTDNGPGIPSNILDKIFQPFFTTKPTGQGTGLGLSLAYDIVKAHGGELKVETKEGEGSNFVIQLPNQ